MFSNQKKQIEKLKADIEKIPVSFTTVRCFSRTKHEEWLSYLEEIKRTFESEVFQFFMFQYREELLFMLKESTNNQYLVGNILAYELIINKMYALVKEYHQKMTVKNEEI